MRDAVRDGRIDRVLGDIASNPPVVVALAIGASRIKAQRAKLHLHFVGGLPGPKDHLARSPHGLRIARHHRDGTEVVQDVFCGNRLAPNPAFGKRQVFRNRCIQVMTHHQHVEMFIERIDRKRTGRVGR